MLGVVDHESTTGIRVDQGPHQRELCPSERLPPVTEFKISSFCSQGGCVEVGHTPDGVVIVRDSKDPLRSVSITFGDVAWTSFLSGLRRGDFDGE
jgi:hypothetical protein